MKTAGVARAAALALAVFAALCFTVGDYGLTFDEPSYYLAAESIRTWMVSEEHSRLDQAWIQKQFEVLPAQNVHPSFTKWLGLPGLCLGRPFDGRLANFRLGTMVFFSIFIFAFYLYLSAALCDLAAFFSVCLLLSMPRVFAHLHFAATDAPLLALWTWVLFSYRSLLSACSSVPRRILTGVLLGLAVSTKITAWFLIPLLVFYGWLVERKPNLRRDGAVFLTAALMFYALNPDYWHRPIERWAEFVAQSVVRKEWAPIATLFFGNVYSFRPPLYYAPVMFLLTTPVPIVLLAVFGFWKMSGERSLRLFFLLTPVFFLILLSMPFTPVHDAERLFLPVMSFVAVFAGHGLCTLWTANTFRRIAVLAIFSLCLAGVVRHHPFQLAYYNALVGGPAGANRVGLETEYWWSCLTPRDLKLISEKLENRKIAFWPDTPYYGYFLQTKEGWIPKSAKVVDPSAAPELVLVLGRPQMDRWWRRGLSKDALFLRESRGVPLWGLFPVTPAMRRLFLS